MPQPPVQMDDLVGGQRCLDGRTRGIGFAGPGRIVETDPGMNVDVVEFPLTADALA